MEEKELKEMVERRKEILETARDVMVLIANKWGKLDMAEAMTRTLMCLHVAMDKTLEACEDYGIGDNLRNVLAKELKEKGSEKWS